MSQSDDPRPDAFRGPLTARQRRVLGVLIEKASTTPAAYPMTVNAIVTGCNQKNNREPVTAYDDIDVEQALGELGVLKLVSEIDWLGRVPKYKHHAYEKLGVNRTEMAVMGELLLRGDQALGDLRARAARMAPIEDLAALKPVVDGLVERGLMLELTPAGRGQIVSHALYEAHELGELRARLSGHAPRGDAPVRLVRADAMPAAPAAPAPPAAAVPPGVLAALSDELTALRERVAELEARVRALEAQAGRGE